MTEKTRLQLLAWAREYHCAAFIQGDPVQFPHRYTQKQDIEVSGLLTAIMSFGNRRQILKKADGLHGLMGASPYRYVLSCRWKEDFLPTDRSSFYRMLSHADFYTYFARLYAAYTRFDSLEDALSVYPGTPMEKLCAFLEVSAKSPLKKLNMFLRWMIRKESEVDFGIWKSFNRRDLLIPLDTHVCRVAYLLGAYRYGNILSEECAEHNRGFGGSLSGRPLFGRFRIVRQRGKRGAVRLGFVLPVYLLNAFAP